MSSRFSASVKDKTHASPSIDDDDDDDVLLLLVVVLLLLRLDVTEEELLPLVFAFALE